MRPHRFALGAAVAFLVAHLAVIFLMRSSALLSNAFLIVVAVATMSASWCHSKKLRGAIRTKWQLLAMGLAFWVAGQSIFTYVDCIRHFHQTTAGNSDFYFFLWGVPVLVAIASTDSEGDDSTVFLALDCVQAILAVLLTYLALFAPASVPLNTAGQPVPIHSLLYLYTAENLVLACAATLRLLSRPPREQRHFYQVLCFFLWSYTLISIPANYGDYLLQGSSGTFLDAFWDIPFLLLLLIGFCSHRGLHPLRKDPGPPAQTTTALIVYNACAALFTIAVLILAQHISHQYATAGTIAGVLALTAYTLRAALLQTRYMQTQQALQQSEKALRNANDRLQEISLSDPLTGIANRRKFEQALEAEWNRALRSGGELSLLMIDVDHFKKINDTLGHVRGDECLMMVARTLTQSLRRSGELLARYGGEEFVAILPAQGEASAYALAEEIRCSVSGLCISLDHFPEPWFVTVSVGVCAISPSLEYSPGTLVASADAAMYRAKQLGRNRTEAVTHGAPLPSLLPVLN